MKAGLTARLMLAYLVVIAGVLLAASRAQQSLAQAQAAAERLGERSVQGIGLAAQLETLMHERSYVSNYLLSHDPTYLDEAERAATLLALDGGRVLASGTRAEVLGSFEGVVERTATPRRRDWAWRRGREFHEYWPGEDAPRDATALVPDLEDVVIALSLLRRRRYGLVS